MPELILSNSGRSRRTRNLEAERLLCFLSTLFFHSIKKNFFFLKIFFFVKLFFLLFLATVCLKVDENESLKHQRYGKSKYNEFNGVHNEVLTQKCFVFLENKRKSNREWKQRRQPKQRQISSNHCCKNAVFSTWKICHKIFLLTTWLVNVAVLVRAAALVYFKVLNKLKCIIFYFTLVLKVRLIEAFPVKMELHIVVGNVYQFTRASGVYAQFF